MQSWKPSARNTALAFCASTSFEKPKASLRRFPFPISTRPQTSYFATIRPHTILDQGGEARGRSDGLCGHRPECSLKLESDQKVIGHLR
jgi:hypothetical protein